MGEWESLGGGDGESGKDQRPNEQGSAQEPQSNPPQNKAGAGHSGGDKINDRGDHQRYSAAQEQSSLDQIRRAEWIMIAFTAVTAVAAAGGLFVSFEQLRLNGKQLEFAENSAAASGSDTRAALKAAERAANAAERQAIATQRALAVSDRLAASAEEQVKTDRSLAISAAAQNRELARSVGVAVEALRFQQSGQIELGVTPMENFGANKTPYVGLMVKNVGTVPVTVKTYYDFQFARADQPATIWQDYKHREAFPIDIPIGQTRYRRMPRITLTGSEIRGIVAGKYSLRIAAVATYTDPSKRVKTVYMCREWFGERATNPVAGFCTTPEDDSSKQKR